MTKPNPILLEGIAESVRVALTEDVGDGDVTAHLIPAENHATAEVILREPAIVCGQPWFNEVFRQVDDEIVIQWHAEEGSLQPADKMICSMAGNARHLLTAERPALNFLQTLSGTATTTADYVKALAGTNTRILDTRKTIPGLRRAQKYAVACGGGKNHRIGLYDQILIKENHIMSAGSISAAVTTARKQFPDLKVEVETESMDEFKQALDAKPDIIMLDNFSEDDMRAAVILNAGQVKIEVSGNVILKNLKNIAATGVDYISSGALTKNLMSIDLSMRFQMQQS